jgi:uncharacterized protein (TIGR02246 family)
MKLLFAILCSGLAACAHAPQATDDTVRGDVTALVQRWSDAGEAGDFAAVADTYAEAPGFVWIEQGEARYTDRAAIVAGLDQAKAIGARITNDVTNIVVTPLGPDVAAFRTDYALTLSSPAFSFSSSGVLSGVAVRRDGVWRFLQGAFSDKPPPRPPRD